MRIQKLIPVLSLTAVLFSFGAKADMQFGAFEAIDSCINEGNGDVDTSKVCSTSQAYNYDAQLYTGQKVTATVIDSATASPAPNYEVTEHIKMAVSLSDPSNFFYQMGEIVTLARIHVCGNVKDCQHSSELRDVQLTLNRDAGQKTLSGSISTDLNFDGGSESASMIQSVEILIPGVFQPMNVGQ